MKNLAAIGGLVSLVASSAMAVPTSPEVNLEKYLETKPFATNIDPSGAEKGEMELAFGGEPIHSRVIRSQNSTGDLSMNEPTGYILSLDDYRTRAGFLFVGSRRNIEKLREEIIGAEIVQVFIRNYDRRNYLLSKKLDAQERNAIINSLDLFYSKPINVLDCLIYTYGERGNGKVARKTIWFQKEK